MRWTRISGREVVLLRDELEMLKRAFRRHVSGQVIRERRAIVSGVVLFLLSFPSNVLE
jgi:hypothetical protein